MLAIRLGAGQARGPTSQPGLIAHYSIRTTALQQAIKGDFVAGFLIGCGSPFVEFDWMIAVFSFLGATRVGNARFFLIG